MVCWMAERPLSPARPLPHQAHDAAPRWPRSTRCCYRIDVNTLHRDEDADAPRAERDRPLRLRLSAPLFVDEYRRNRATGSFILIDESTNDTVGAGMVL